MRIRLLTNDADYENALGEIRRLWNADVGSSEAETLELLAMLAHRYEREREPLPALNPIEAIKFRMEQQGLPRRALLEIFGTAGRTSEVLRGKRSLSLEMIRKLHWKLGIPFESLIPEQPPRTRPRRAAKKASRRRAA